MIARLVGIPREGLIEGQIADLDVEEPRRRRGPSRPRGLEAAVVTNDTELADRMRSMRDFGFSDYDKVIHVGINGKMTEVCAAMGLTSLETMPEIVAVNRRNWEAYRESLRALPGISLIKYDPTDLSNYHYSCD